MWQIHFLMMEKYNYEQFIYFFDSLFKILKQNNEGN